MGQNPSSNRFLCFKMRDAAKDGRLIICKCALCRRVVRFLAADLEETKDPGWDPHVPPFPCSKCKTTDYIFVEIKIPVPGDYGSLMVRRPGPVRKTQTWRNVLLGD